MKSYVSAGAALCLFLLTAASFAANSAVPAELAETGAGYSSGAGTARAREPVFPTTLRALPLKTTRTLRRRAKIRKKRKQIKTIKK